MGRTNTANVQEEEVLAFEVKKYPKISRKNIKKRIGKLMLGKRLKKTSDMKKVCSVLIYSFNVSQNVVFLSYSVIYIL